MAACYGCNSRLPCGVRVERRTVKVGNSSWGLGRGRSYYSARAFCATCARERDKAMLFKALGFCIIAALVCSRWFH